MTLRHQKFVSAFLIAIVAFGGLEALVYIVNLNQPLIFLKAGFFIWVFLALKISILYDLHFKNPGALARAKARHESISHWFLKSLAVLLSAFGDRVSHLLKKHHWLQFQNYLILPAMVFWATVTLLYIDFGNARLQQVLVLLSGLAMIVNYWFLKEAFLRKTEKVDRDIFAGLAAVKIYASAIAYTAALAIMRRFCLARFCASVWVRCLPEGHIKITLAFFRGSIFPTHSKIGWGIMTMPGPPPKGRSSTLRYLSRVKSRRS